jgi:hypothetical protein
MLSAAGVHMCTFSAAEVQLGVWGAPAPLHPPGYAYVRHAAAQTVQLEI